MDSSQSNLTSQSGSLFTGELESTTSDNITDTLLSSTSSLTVGDSDLHITKEMINEKQLQHDLELAKIELSQKNLVIDTMKAEYLSKIDEVEEKLSDAIHQKQIIIAKFQNQMRTLREEYNHENKNLKQQVQFLLQKQREINLDNEKLTEKAIKSKDLLTNLDIDEDEYLSIKGKNPDELTLREFIAVSCYFSLFYLPRNLQIASGKSSNKCIHFLKNLKLLLNCYLRHHCLKSMKSRIMISYFCITKFHYLHAQMTYLFCDIPTNLSRNL